MAQPDFSDGSMLALYPRSADARRLAVDNGLDPDSLHLTIAYTGKAADTDRKQLRKAARKLADRGPVVATLSGHARFTSDPKTDAIVALVDSPQLDALRADAVDELADRGIEAAANHGFTAHVSLAYVGKDDADPVGRLPSRKIVFDGVTATHGGNKKTHLFDTTLAEAAREAYTAGVVLAGAPVTEAITAGCAAAVIEAIEHADDPAILEATLQLGKLHGTWALLFARRETLIQDRSQGIREAWDAITVHIDTEPTIKRLHAELGQVHESDGWTKMVATSAASSLLSGVYAHDKHQALQATVVDALRAGWAEGRTGALALNAEKHGHEVTETDSPQFSFQTAYDAIYDQLAHLPELPLQAQQWIQRMLNGAASSIGTLLARLLDENATRTEIAEALTEALSAAGAGSASYRAVTLFADQAISQAMSLASIALYQEEGVEDVYFVDAADERVCPACEAAAAGSPYAPDLAPVPGLHCLCRCVLVPEDPAPFKALAALALAA